MSGQLGRDPKPIPEQYPIGALEENLRKAGHYFGKALEAHGKKVLAVEVAGALIVVARAGTTDAVRLSEWLYDSGVAHVDRERRPPHA